MEQILILLLSAVVCVTAMRRLHLPPILGYLLIGAILGPYGANYLSNSHVVEWLSELGIVFLLFAIGLEMHLSQFLAMRSVLLRLGFLQMGGATAICALILKVLGMPAIPAVIGGAALALCSTAILLKQLQDQQELSSRVGQLAFGLLIFQDLAAIPFLIAIPVLASGAEPWALFVALSVALLKGAAVLAIMVWAGRKTLGRFFTVVARARSSEVFTLAVLWVALAAAFVTQKLGLSMSMGAFLAGLVLGDSKFRHQVLSDIRPFRDMLLGLFFVSVGLTLNMHELWAHADSILLGLLALCAFKGISHGWLGWYFSGKRLRAGARFGIIMAHSGEFGILLLSLAGKEGLIAPEWKQPLLAIVVLSLFLAVFFVKYNQSWTRFLEKREKLSSEHLKTVSNLAPVSEQAVIICGFGRVGQILARFFRKSQIPYVALDLDAKQIQEASAEGEPVFYGDASQVHVLQSVGLSQSRLVVLCVDDIDSTLDIVRAVRSQSLDIPLIVRTRDDAHLEALLQAGATEVVPEILEASLMLVSHILLMLGNSSETVYGLVKSAKQERYRLLKGFYDSEHDTVSVEGEPVLVRHAIILCPGSRVEGLPIEQILAWPCWKGVTWDAIVRDNISYPLQDWEHDQVVKAEDALVVVGTAEDVEQCERCLLSGVGGEGS